MVDPADIPNAGTYDEAELDVLLYELKADLNAYFGDLDESQKRMHTANVLHAARNMRAQ